MTQAAAQPPDSTLESQRQAVVAILRSADIVRRQLEKVTQAHGVTGQQYNVLRILRGALPDPLPTLEIRERMIEQTPGVTRLLDRLERKKLIARERNAEDRRQVLCSITAAGLKLLQKMDEEIDAANGAVVDMLSSHEVNELVRILSRMQAAE